ncbi:ELM1/GtrOC1 family putative glycosyltransferase [Candidatus Omnitrophota bacterium]
MKKNSAVDFLGYILLRSLGPLIRALPFTFNAFLGRRLGDLLYYFDLKHKARAYSQIKAALGEKLSPRQINQVTKKFYRNFAQNIIEAFLLPKMDKEYIRKFVTIEGEEHIRRALKEGRGVILIGAHLGNWELYAVVCSHLGLKLNLFIREQGYPLINKLLNSYRARSGCKLIQRRAADSGKEDELYGLGQLIKALKNNETVGIMADQGGRGGTLVDFFGRSASMASGGVRLALKYGAAVIPTFYIRQKGPQVKLVFSPAVRIEKYGDQQADIRNNLQRVISIFEAQISKYPEEYFWTYKIWKYSDQKRILILDDGKAGHLRQAQALSRLAQDSYKDKGIVAKVQTIRVKFKRKLSAKGLALSSCLADRYHCQGCLWCLRRFLEPDTYKDLISIKADMIISCGSSIAPLNFILSRENLAKSVVALRPSILSTKRFDLVVMPKHDHPPRRKNIAVTEGALNLVNDRYLEESKALAANRVKLTAGSAQGKKSLPVIGLLLGGDAKRFELKNDLVMAVAAQIKKACEGLNASLMITTSRRTPPEAEQLIKEEFKGYPRCRLLVIAGENNFPAAVGGILASSDLLVVSPESISMISEAAASAKYTFVFDPGGIDVRHAEFLRNFADKGYIYITRPDKLSEAICGIWKKSPKVASPDDNSIVREAMGRII